MEFLAMIKKKKCVNWAVGDPILLWQHKEAQQRTINYRCLIHHQIFSLLLFLANMISIQITQKIMFLSQSQIHWLYVINNFPVKILLIFSQRGESTEKWVGINVILNQTTRWQQKDLESTGTCLCFIVPLLDIEQKILHRLAWNIRAAELCASFSVLTYRRFPILDLWHLSRQPVTIQLINYNADHL